MDTICKISAQSLATVGKNRRQCRFVVFLEPKKKRLYIYKIILGLKSAKKGTIHSTKTRKFAESCCSHISDASQPISCFKMRLGSHCQFCPLETMTLALKELVSMTLYEAPQLHHRRKGNNKKNPMANHSFGNTLRKMVQYCFHFLEVAHQELSTLYPMEYPKMETVKFGEKKALK